MRGGWLNKFERSFLNSISDSAKFTGYSLKTFKQLIMQVIAQRFLFRSEKVHPPF